VLVAEPAGRNIMSVSVFPPKTLEPVGLQFPSVKFPCPDVKFQDLGKETMLNAGCSSGVAPYLSDETSISKRRGQTGVGLQFQPVKTDRCRVKITKSRGKVDILRVIARIDYGVVSPSHRMPGN
jgi:hypothetical protein